MRFSFLSIVAVLFATVSAQTKPNAFTLPSDFMITAGQPTTVTWTPSTPGTVTIRLRQGASSDLDQGVVVGCKSLRLPLMSTKMTDHSASAYRQQREIHLHHTSEHSP